MSLSIDEAIRHAEDKARELGCTECAQEHRQLAAWLRELKFRRKAHSVQPISRALSSACLIASSIDRLITLLLHAGGMKHDARNRDGNVAPANALLTDKRTVFIKILSYDTDDIIPAAAEILSHFAN